MENLAHVAQDKNNEWRTQTLREHSCNVAAMALSFASNFGNSDWCEIAGLLHDLGKALRTWQSYIREVSGYESCPDDGERGNHSTLGALYLLDKYYKQEQILSIDSLKSLLIAYLIIGHHAGLPDYYEGNGLSLQSRLLKADAKDAIKDLELLEEEKNSLLSMALPSSPPALKGVAQECLHLWMRMLFSCLVDADYLDTERFMRPDIYALRSNYLSLSELKKRFDNFMSEMTRNAPQTRMNRIRSNILQTCIEKGRGEPGFYSLTVPTGGGKTLAVAAFGLEHAKANHMTRIIMAVPYTSIIEQTAKVYKYGTDDDKKIQENIRTGKVLFGEENVLEHHSNIDPEKELYKHALASQNWDAPIIVTTNVQLLQSLHASKTSSCRKLHNIANSVIIFDEAQMLPAQYLEPVIATLKGLVKSFGVTILFCTATQPALTGKIGSVVNAFTGIDGCREIIDDPASLMDELRRVDYSVAPADLNGTLQWTDVAEELKKERQALCIVNTRKDCRDLHALMPEGTIHLSGFMCGEEISSIISDIKTRLRNNEEIRVISTQLVECGVDLNFPVVWRALAGIDSITQAAGRCNREGTLEGKGRVVVFVPPSAAPPGDIKIGSQVARSMLSGFSLGDATPQTFSEYFRQFYASQKNLDKPDFKDLLVKEALQGRFMFRTFAEQFKIIDDTRQRSVIVPYEGGKNSGLALIDELRRFGPTRVLMAKLQRFTVNVPTGMFDELCSSGAVENVAGYFVLAGSFYQKGKGVVTGNHSWKPEDYIV